MVWVGRQSYHSTQSTLNTPSLITNSNMQIHIVIPRLPFTKHLRSITQLVVLCYNTHLLPTSSPLAIVSQSGFLLTGCLIGNF